MRDVFKKLGKYPTLSTVLDLTKGISTKFDPATGAVYKYLIPGDEDKMSCSLLDLSVETGDNSVGAGAESSSAADSGGAATAAGPLSAFAASLANAKSGSRRSTSTTATLTLGGPGRRRGSAAAAAAAAALAVPLLGPTHTTLFKVQRGARYIQHRSNINVTVSHREAGVLRLLRKAAGLDADALAERDALDVIAKREAKLASKKKFIKSNKPCTCKGSGSKCKGLQWCAKNMYPGYELAGYQWRSRKRSDGQCDIDDSSTPFLLPRGH